MPTQLTLPQKLTPAELESHLWEAANILRGSPVDRTDWKSYILPLLFFKRICDVWDEEYAEAVETYGEDFDEDHRFEVPEGCHWKDVRETPTNVGQTLQNAMPGIERANQEHLYGVFGDAPWTNKERLPDDLIKDLVEHFSALPLGNKDAEADVIGDAYEFLIKKFADATNKKAGEFYTPRSVVRLMIEILDPQEGEVLVAPRLEGTVISAGGVAVEEEVFEDFGGFDPCLEVFYLFEPLGQEAFDDEIPDPVGGPERVFEGVVVEHSPSTSVLGPHRAGRWAVHRARA